MTLDGDTTAGLADEIMNITAADVEAARALWRVLFLVCCACSLIAASLYMTVPVELALWGGLYLLRTRRWRDLRGFVACGIPLVICAVFVKI